MRLVACTEHVCKCDTVTRAFTISIIQTVTLSDKKKAMDESSAAWRNVMMEGSQSAGDRHIGRVDEQKETSEGDYEEVENIFNAPFAMEYNVSYSMVTQTAM